MHSWRVRNEQEGRIETPRAVTLEFKPEAVRLVKGQRSTGHWPSQ